MCYNAQRLCRNDACSKLCIMKRTEAYENGDHRTIQIRKGQQDTGGDWTVKFLTGAIPQVKAMMTASAAATTGLRTWFEVFVPGLSDAFFVVAQPGSKVPLPDVGSNAALEFDISLTIQEYIGLQPAVAPTAAT